jgi:hypothetical protein
MNGYTICQRLNDDQPIDGLPCGFPNPLGETLIFPNLNGHFWGMLHFQTHFQTPKLLELSHPSACEQKAPGVGYLTR